MLVYTLKRLLQMVPPLLGITFITFLIISLAPGDPVATSMGAGGGPAAAVGARDPREPGKPGGRQVCKTRIEHRASSLKNA